MIQENPHTETAVKSPSRARRAVKKTFSSLRNRNFKLFFVGQTISNTGNWLTNVALTLLVLKITGSGLQVGLLAACQYGPILFLTVYGGAIADRSDKRKMLVLTQALEMAQSIGLAIMAFLPHPPVSGLFILAIFGGLFLAFDNPLRRSFVSEMVPQEDIPNAVVLNSTIINASRIVGPALAGFLVVSVGYGWCFVVDAVSYLAVICSLFMMRPSELYRVPPREKTKGEVRESFKYVFSVPVLWVSFVMLAVIGTLAYNFTVTLPLFVEHTLHKNEAVFTILYSVFGIGALIGGFAAAHKGLVKIGHIIWSAVALGVVMILLAMTSSLAFAAPVVFFLGIAGVMYTISTTTMVQLETKREMLGRVLALQSVLLMGTTPIGGPFSGWIADTFGTRVPLIVGGVACLLAAGYGYLATKKNEAKS